MIAAEFQPPDWDANGAFSIVVQGGLFADNLVQTSNHCAHWRDLFPNAEIILAISVTDLLDAQSETTLDPPLSFLPHRRGDGRMDAALSKLQRSCDRVLVSAGANPLPPLKLDGHGANNVNLQIAAATAGLAAATGSYVLRTRSDLLFATRRFLEQYARGERAPRGPAAVLKQRVMSSWLYTLNPYTIERMAFHLSDWFHFGLLADVRCLWDVPFMTLADSVHHRLYPHEKDSNIDERKIVPRLAVEQHILFNAISRLIPNLILKSSDDWSSRDAWVDILTDNFNLCDLGAADVIFEKYAFDFHSPTKRRHCVTREDWLAMTALEGEARRRVLSESGGRQGPAFPVAWTADQLATKQGFRGAGNILARPGGGVLTHGPYASIAAGRYRAVLEAPCCRGPGAATLRATLDEGLVVLAEQRFELERGGEATLDLPFDVFCKTGRDFELVCEIEGSPQIAITGLTISQRSPGGYAEVGRYKPNQLPMMQRVGLTVDGGVTTNGMEGHLLFGPSLTLAAGVYSVTFEVFDIVDANGAVFEVAVELRGRPDQQVISFSDWNAESPDAITLGFSLPELTRRVEFRVWVTSRTSLAIGSVTLFQN